MEQVYDGPQSPLFRSVDIGGTVPVSELSGRGLSEELSAALEHTPRGSCVFHGVPFQIDRVHLVKDSAIRVAVKPFSERWLVFLHTSDLTKPTTNKDGLTSPVRGTGALNDHAATYTVVYDDDSSEDVQVRRRHHLGAFQRQWGENCFQAVPHMKPSPLRAHHEQPDEGTAWGRSQTRSMSNDMMRFAYWLYAWENPHPERPIVEIRFAPVSGAVVVGGLAVGTTDELPIRWQPRKKALVRLAEMLPAGRAFDPTIDEQGLLSQIRIDLGQVISAMPRRIYPNDSWEQTYNNKLPVRSDSEVLVEYTAHPEARFHFEDGRTVRVCDLRDGSDAAVVPVAEATRRVTVRAVDGAGRQVPVKLHIHGESGEYLSPVDRHRIPNHAWFEDYSTDFVHTPVAASANEEGQPYASHFCTYIPGETRVDLPIGTVYVEVSKGYEIRPVRRRVTVGANTDVVEIRVEHVLPWREKGWVSADTHVHFLSPQTALLEGSAEGVNVVNLLASQWGELMTNVGDFDGRTTWGSREAGGDGEYLVRVGTENRQHVMGHISLLGYEGSIIAPMTTGGPDESALGDPVGVLLTEWAAQCRDQNGVVVIPHFPNPRAEHAATIVEGKADGIEMTSWGNLYAGINPYSLSDWYRYLNCGYPVAAVGGTDKMSAATAVGTVRTYARVAGGREWSFDAWKQAVRRMETFVTYGPLLELSVDGRPMGSRIELPKGGGVLDVSWEVQSVTVPVSRVELVVNGEIIEGSGVDAPRNGRSEASGSWSVKVARSSWIALLVRGHYADRPEIIAAHSSPVMACVDGSEFYAAADALTILEQIEGAMAYLDTAGTRAEQRARKRMRMVLETAHRRLHTRMHELGHFHEHTPAEDHGEHR